MVAPRWALISIRINYVYVYCNRNKADKHLNKVFSYYDNDKYKNKIPSSL